MIIEQQNSDFCYEVEEQKEYKRNSFNSRYNYFRQNYYTAGDLEQILEKWGNYIRNEERNKEIIKKYGTIPIEFNQELCIHDYFNTFRYIQEKFKKGCFLQIKNNKLETFLPFSKQGFKNEWGNKVIIDPKFESIENMMRYIHNYDKTFPFDEKKIHRDVYSWYGNNGLVRFEFPLTENDSGYNMLKDMIVTLCKEREIPDVDFFLNKRDFPILNKDKTEAYDSFFGKNQNLLSHHYEKYVPILSMNVTDNSMDIPIPTWDDWRFIANVYDGKLFGKEYTIFPKIKDFDQVKWEDKIPTIIWRGSSTGRGTTEKDNIRLFLHNYSKRKERDDDNHLFMDINITKWNLRPRKHPNNPYLRTILREDFDFEKGNYMSIMDQIQYKYCINLPGHSCAYRLSLQLFSGSLVFSYPCENRLWFYNQLEPWKHYIPIEKEFSIEEIIEKIKWCKKNDEKCKKIVENARCFAEKYLSKDGILDYLQKVCCSIADKNKILYSEKSLHSIQQENIKEKLFQYEESQKQFFPEFYKSSIWIMNKRYISNFFYNLKKDKKFNLFLEKNKKKENLIQSKKTNINLYEYRGVQWIEKIIKKNWKRDDLHQIFIGYFFINNLVKVCPHFVHTYSHIEEEDQTKIYLEYKNLETLDKLIRDKKLTFQNLIHIWVNICCGLEIAQNYCGFLHMDLYPWNILIEPKKKKIKYHSLGIETDFDLVPIMIDYGNSHVVDNGTHYYNTTPFQLNSSNDILCMVLSSLDIFLSKMTLTSHDSKILFSIMKYFYETSSIPNKNFFSIHHVKQFIKVNKKFSNILCNMDRIERKKPIDFIYFLFRENYINREKFHFFSLDSQLRFSSIHFPNIFQLFFNEMEMIRYLLKTDESKKIDIETIFTLYRRIFIHFKKILKIIKYKNQYQKIYINHIVHFFIHEYRKGILFLENLHNMKVWKNHNIDDVLNILDNYPLPKIFDSILSSVIPYENNKPKVPFLKTHICIRCQDNRSDVSEDFFDKLQLLYIRGYQINYFQLRNQIL